MNNVVYTVHLMNDPKKEDSLTLELLEAIDDKSDLTQRHLADRMGVALGLANSYLKRCVRKGLVKIHQAQPLSLLPDTQRLCREKPVDRQIPLLLAGFLSQGESGLHPNIQSVLFIRHRESLFVWHV